MKQRTQFTGLILLTLSFIMPSICAGQSLPSIQEKSLRIPVGMKIDGKAAEFNNTFQAYNKTTYLYYTLSNDDDNLYLVIQSKNVGINHKIFHSGITFTVNPYGSKNEKEGMAVTFPAITESYRTALRKPIAGLALGRNEDSTPKNEKGAKPARETASQADSMVGLRHKVYLTYAKEIGIANIQEINTPTISIYNDKDISTKITVGDNNVLTYELSVPLRYFKLSTSTAGDIAYQITLNDYSALYKGTRPPRLIIQGDPRGLGGIDIRLLDSRLDFWGSYKLAK